MADLPFSWPCFRGRKSYENCVRPATAAIPRDRDAPPMSIAAIPLSQIVSFGRGLHRPECVLPTASGDVYVPDWRGGVAVVRADGSTQSWLAQGFDLKPNGIGFLPDGHFLIANL